MPIRNRLERLSRKLRRRRFFREAERRFSADEFYGLGAVERGFSEWPDPADDSALLQRIIDSYREAKSGQAAAAPCYQVGNEWLPIFRHHFGPVMDALSQGNVEDLAKIYKNFWRNGASAGLVGLSTDMSKFFRTHIDEKDKKRFLHDTLHRFRLWQELLGRDADVRALESPAVGNPYGFFFGDSFVKSGADYLHYYATVIGRLVEGAPCQVVAELGGGYGGTAYYLLRDNPSLTYVDFDLPENMALTAYYLLKALPESRALLYGEDVLSAETLDHYDLVLLPNFAVEQMPPSSAELVFNSYSLAEMPPPAIAAYVREFTSIARSWLLHVNHTRNSLVVADEFGFDPEQFSLIYRKPARWNEGRSASADEFEFLYKKRGPRASTPRAVE